MVGLAVLRDKRGTWMLVAGGVATLVSASWMMRMTSWSPAAATRVHLELKARAFTGAIQRPACCALASAGSFKICRR
jgi:hypothetical protein